MYHVSFSFSTQKIHFNSIKHYILIVYVAKIQDVSCIMYLFLGGATFAKLLTPIPYNLIYTLFI